MFYAMTPYKHKLSGAIYKHKLAAAANLCLK